jgi:hypothetical protein
MKTLREILGKPVLFHVVYWHGKDGTPSLTGYSSNDPNVIGDQLSAMQNLGGEGCGVVALTYGPTVSPWIHGAVMEACRQANERQMPFCLCFDPWTVKTAPDKTAAMIAALKHPDTQTMLNSRSYLNGRPVLDFNTGANKTVVLSAVPGIDFWQIQQDYDWVQIPPVANKTQLPCVYLQFDDGTGPDRNKSVWDQTKPARIIPPLAGATFNQIKLSAGNYVQFATWNDISEGTDIEKFASMLRSPK